MNSPTDVANAPGLPSRSQAMVVTPMYAAFEFDTHFLLCQLPRGVEFGIEIDECRFDRDASSNEDFRGNRTGRDHLTE